MAAGTSIWQTVPLSALNFPLLQKVIILNPSNFTQLGRTISALFWAHSFFVLFFAALSFLSQLFPLLCFFWGALQAEGDHSVSIGVWEFYTQGIWSSLTIKSNSKMVALHLLAQRFRAAAGNGRKGEGIKRIIQQTCKASDCQMLYRWRQTCHHPMRPT